MINLKIPKKYLVRQYKGTAFGRGGFELNVEHYVFGIPGAEFDGYTFTAFSAFDIGRFGKITLLGDWYNVEVLYDDTPITLKRTENREDGKKYKQYKLKPAELAGMYGCDLQHVVALVSIYRNNGKMTASEVIETKYVVGAVDGCWFICSELAERRRLDTKGVRVLGYISPSDAATVTDIIEQHKKKEREIYDAIGDIQHNRRDIQDLDRDVARIGMTELDGIKDITAKALESLSKQYDKLIADGETENRNFESALVAYYIDKAA